MAADGADDKPFLLYGANGYTGRLIAERAAAEGLRPVLAGRREEAVRPLAEGLGLPWRVFALDDGPALDRELAGFPAILLCAGPFSHTSRPVVDACLRVGTSYLDITGEIAVFEAIHARGAQAREAGVVLLPGVGFDVVPTDCLAASLAAALPGARRLVLAFRGVGDPSRGTLATMVEGAAEGGAIRRDGRIERVPTAWRRRTIPFRDVPREAMTIPWGDVSTAFYSTGIPDIEVYMAMPPRMITLSRLTRPLLGALRSERLQRLLKKRIERRAAGPSEEIRRSGRSQIWGSVEAADGRRVTGTLVTPEGYQLTAMTALDAARRVSRGEVPPGAHTPSTAFGAGYVTGIEGCDMRIEVP